MASGAGSRLKAVIVGAGNVAWGLAPALQAGGEVDIIRVVARHADTARALAEKLGPEVEWSTDTASADSGADMVIVAASDGAVASIAEANSGSQAIWVHTSGSVETSVLAKASLRYGVIYPMQTFTRGVAVDLSDAAIYTEGSDPEVEALVDRIARSVSSRVAWADSRRRRKLHCAAVFACNFVNHLWTIASGVANEAGGSLGDFMPLINETLRKARTIGPERGQTGPARRGATAVMEAHEALLPDDLRQIYHILSQSIMNHRYEQD